MENFEGEFIQRVKRTPTIESFRFNLDKKVDFYPGQFSQVIFDKENSGNSDLNKYLSFSSAPGKDYIEVTKRLSDSPFSKRLKNLNSGNKVFFKGPMGKCVLKPEYKKIGFLIGGIGITPVISILEHINTEELDTDSVLIFSNRTKEEIPFKDKLDQFNKKENINILYAITDQKVVNQEYISARIDKSMIAREMPDIKERIIFLFGPPGMVKAIEDICLEVGVKKDNLRIENFIGY